jgi:steroid delta-isomerase-like uncharacterized protein
MIDHPIPSKGKAGALRSIATRWIKEVWQERDVEAIDRLHAVDFIDRSPGDRGPTRDDYKQGLREFFEVFPDFHTTIEDLVVDPDRSSVAIRWTARGTHARPYLGVPPSGKQIAFAGIEIIRVENGQITERWGEWDGIELLRQLGAWTP